MKSNLELKLKSLLTAPKSKSGAKAFALALSFAFLPFWFSAIAFLTVYFSPFVFPVPFVFSAVASLYALNLVISLDGSYWAFFLGLDLFFILFAVKDYSVSEREKVFSMLVAAVSTIILFGFFSGLVSPFLLFLVALALSVDLFSFSPDKFKHLALSGVVALISAELAWLVGLLGFPPYFSTAFVFALISAAVFALTRHLKGTLIGTNALYLSFAVPIVALLSAFIALFS